MTVSTALTNIGELDYDPDNPRLWSSGHTTNQTQIARNLLEQDWYQGRAQAIAHGLDPLDQPFLAFRDSDRITVVDGNLRLLTLRLMIDPEYAVLVGAADLPTVDSDQQRRISNVPVALYPSWDDIHPIRVYRQRLHRCNWDAYTSALDYDRLAAKGVDYDSIAAMYNVVTDAVHSRMIALHAFQQVGTYMPRPPKPFPNFRIWESALQHESIRGEIALTQAKPTDPAPIHPDQLHDAAELMAFLTGCLPRPGSTRNWRVIDSASEISDLARIYGDENALGKLRAWPAHPVEDLIDQMDGAQNSRNVHRVVNGLHQAATDELAKLKSDVLSPMSGPTSIHVASTRHSIFNDRHTHYVVELSSRDPAWHHDVPARLQSMLEDRGYRCEVLFQ